MMLRLATQTNTALRGVQRERHMPYNGPALDLDTFTRDWEKLAPSAGLELGSCGQDLGVALPYAIREAAGGAPRLFLSAGIHGDEPAGPLALLACLREGLLPEHADIVVFPLLNAEGLANGTRDHPAYGDLNRDYRDFRSPLIRAQRDFLEKLGWRFDLATCLHEDWETEGYYLYEVLTGGASGCGRAILDAVAPICGIHQEAEIEGAEADNGLISRDGIDIDPADIGGWPEALYLAEHGSLRTYTLESPSAQQLEVRVAAHVAALKLAMAQ